MKHLKSYSSTTGNHFDLMYSEVLKVGRAVGPLPSREGAASVGSVGPFVEVSAKTEEDAIKLLAEKIEEKEEKTLP